MTKRSLANLHLRLVTFTGGRDSLVVATGRLTVFAYHMKDRMCRILLEHYDKRKEVLSAPAMIVERAGYVKLEHGRLKVTLRRFKNREIDYAARHLCEDLNRMQPFTSDKFHIPFYYDVQ